VNEEKMSQAHFESEAAVEIIFLRGVKE